jgi:MscS family membrane protein
LREPLPEAYFTGFGDFALNMSLFFWVNDYSQVFSVTDKVNSRLIIRLQENGIVIPYPIRTVQLEKDA